MWLVVIREGLNTEQLCIMEIDLMILSSICGDVMMAVLGIFRGLG